MKCEFCKKEHNGSYGSGRFCSIKCARTFSSKENKILKFCLFCEKEIIDSAHKAKSKFCSKECFFKFQNKNLVENWLKTGKPNNYTGGKRGLAPTSGYIRRYIIEKQNDECAICKIKNEWMKKELKFVLDHIDGNCLNNKRENLRLLCPNCNSQTNTFSGRNRGKGRKFNGFIR